MVVWLSPKLIAAPLQQKLLKAGLLVLSMALLIYPYFGYRDYYNILQWFVQRVGRFDLAES